MSDPGLGKRCVCVTSALALVLAVMTSPMRPLSTSGLAFAPNHFSRHFTSAASYPTGQPVKSIGASQLSLKARPSERQEKLSTAIRLVRRSVEPARTHPTARAPEAPLSGTPSAPHPLRC